MIFWTILSLCLEKLFLADMLLIIFNHIISTGHNLNVINIFHFTKAN